MGRIKSALEIALERTESVKGDKGSIEQFEAKQRGKRLANEFLEGGVSALGEQIKECPREQRDSLKQGLFDVFFSQITLPAVKEDLQRLETVGRGLQGVLADNRFASRYKQFLAAMAQFLGEAGQYEEAIRRQYAPKLQQKEEELSRRLGQRVALNPFQDPEFVAFYNQHMGGLRGNYEAVVEDIKAYALQAFPQP